MTIQDIREKHIPHRVNLLLTFRERFRSNNLSPQALEELANKHGRDFYRCSKDICFVMTRYFMEAMGIHLPEGASNAKNRKKGPTLKCISESLDIEILARDTTRYPVLLEMLKAGNRAVAHLEESDVDHYFDSPEKDQEMMPIIDWIEGLIIDKIYDGRKKDFDLAMVRDNNRMNR